MVSIACFAERSILKLLGFGLQSNVFVTPQIRDGEFMIFD